MHTATSATPAPPILRVDTGDGHVVTIRPMQPGDAAADRRFLESLSPESRRARFLGSISHVDDRLMDLLASEDASGPLAVVATMPGDTGMEIIGVARLSPSDATSAECALTVADAWQRRGLGLRLFDALKRLAASRGIRRLYSVDATSKAGMRAVAPAVGAHARRDPQDPAQVVYELELA
jgi:GNAT superfamily N-acetyltransferase